MGPQLNLTSVDGFESTSTIASAVGQAMNKKLIVKVTFENRTPVVAFEVYENNKLTLSTLHIENAIQKYNYAFTQFMSEG